MQEEVLFKKLSPNGIIPSRAEPNSAGLDLYAAETVTIAPLSRALVKTDIAWAAPDGYYGRIAPRSGLAVKQGLDILAGVLDESYRNNIGVVLFNTDKDKEIIIEKGDRCAQLIIERYYNLPIKEVGELPESIRGESGFGASGK